MGLKDPHDPRTFTHFARFDAKGNVVAIVEIADSAIGSAAHPTKDGSSDIYVDVTPLAKAARDLHTLTVDPVALQAIKDAPNDAALAKATADIQKHAEAIDPILTVTRE